MLFNNKCQRCEKDLSLNSGFTLIPNLVYREIIDGFDGDYGIKNNKNG